MDCRRNAHISQTIRPDLVVKAAKALAKTPLYQELDIQFDDNWESNSYKDVSEEFLNQHCGTSEGPRYHRDEYTADVSFSPGLGLPRRVLPPLLNNTVMLHSRSGSPRAGSHFPRVRKH